MKPFRNLLLLSMICLSTNHFVNAQSKIDSIEIQKSYYHSAMNEIKDMLDGKTPLSYEKAIFLMENAYYEDKLKYSRFQDALDFYTHKIKSMSEITRVEPEISKTILETKEAQLNNYNKALLNYSIFKFLTDTTYSFVNYDSSNQVIYIEQQMPIRYSILDPFGTDNWKNTQIINLLQTNTGNCFALSSLFKIFSDRLNSEANLCTAPGHVYIRHADDKGIYFNVELGTQSFPGTGSLKTLTYTTNEALKNDLSLRELNLKQSVNLCLVYLAKGYEYKFGIKSDVFTTQIANQALNYDSLSLNAMLLKAGILEETILKKEKNVTLAKKEVEFKEYEKLIEQLYTLGYREMPLEMKNLIVSSIKKDSAVFISQNHTPQPYKSIGIKDNRYASLSWGMFEEVHENKPFEQYGRTMFDTKNKKISNFIEIKTLYNEYNFDPVVFALSIDPIGGTFPMLTPYQFASNTPIQAIDYDGLEGFVITRTGYNIGKGTTNVVTSNQIKWGTYTIIWQLLSDRDRSVVIEERTERNKPFIKTGHKTPEGVIDFPAAGVIYSTTEKGIQSFDGVKDLIRSTVEKSKNEQLAAAAPIGSKTTKSSTFTEQQKVFDETFTKEITQTTTKEVTGLETDIEVNIEAVNIGSEYVQKLSKSLTQMGYKIALTPVSSNQLVGTATLNIEDKANPNGVNVTFSVGVNTKTKNTTTTTLNKVTHDQSGQTVTNPNQ